MQFLMERTQPPAQRDESELDRLLASTGGDLLVASNRQPYRHDYAEDDEIAVDRPAGGLTAGIDAVMRRVDGEWVAWGDGDADGDVVDDDDRVSVPPENDDEAYTLQRIWLSDEEVEHYYYRISNQVLWPVCHAALDNVESCRDAWADYRSVNDRFADRLAGPADGGDVVWLQDYHLSLAPRTIRERTSGDPFLVHSWHVPWPTWDTFRACPRGTEILDGLLANDLIGFHVPRYCENFLRSVDAALSEAEVDFERGRVTREGETTAVRSFPMGVPVDRVREQARSPTATGFMTAFRRNRGVDPDTRLGVGVDRLDYTKGIPQRLDAIERFLADHPDWQGEFTYVQVGTESRSAIPAYERCQERVEAAVERVNDRFATDDWQPVVYTTEMLSNEALAALYRHADLALVSPVRDGMNLVAQEYVAASGADGDGVLVLSDQAGVHDQLGDAAVSVSPFDTVGFADAIHEALTMPTAERRSRLAAMHETVVGNDIETWVRDVLQTVQSLQGDRSS